MAAIDDAIAAKQREVADRIYEFLQREFVEHNAGTIDVYLYDGRVRMDAASTPRGDLGVDLDDLSYPVG